MTRREDGWVAVTQQQLEANIGGTAFAVLVLLAKHRSHDYYEDDATYPQRARLARGLGLPRVERSRPEDQAASAAATRTISRATATLEQHGLIVRGRERPRPGSRKLRVYVLPGRGRRERYVRVEHELLDLIATRHLTPDQFQALCRWRFLAGENRTTKDSVTAFAARFNEKARNVRQHRSALIELGLLEVLDHRGRASETTVPRSADLLDRAAALAWGTPAKSGRIPRRNLAAYPGEIWPHTPAKSGRQDRDPVERDPADRVRPDRAAPIHQGASLTVRARDDDELDLEIDHTGATGQALRAGQASTEATGHERSDHRRLYLETKRALALARAEAESADLTADQELKPPGVPLRRRGAS